MSVVWKNPPEFGETQVGKVMTELKKHPGEWASIAVTEGFAFMPWYAPILEDPRFEHRVVHLQDLSFGRREIYARYVKE